MAAHRLGKLDWPIPRGVGVLRYSGAHFLIAMVLMLVMAPFIEYIPAGDLIESAVLTIVLISAALAIGSHRRILIWSMILVTPALVAKWASHVHPDAFVAEVSPAASLVFVAFVIYHLFKFILLAPRVDSEVLCAGVATFLTLALLWAFAYVLVDRLVPGSFAYTFGPESSKKMAGFVSIYFSLVTLCTVGFGDIVPTTGPARMLAMLEGVAGVFYVAVMVARLVSLYSAEKLIAKTQHAMMHDKPHDGGASSS